MPWASVVPFLGPSYCYQSSLSTVKAKDWPFAEVAEDPMLYPLGSLLLATLLVKFYWYRLGNCGTGSSWQIVAGAPLIRSVASTPAATVFSCVHLRLSALAWEHWSCGLSYLAPSHLLCEIQNTKYHVVPAVPQELVSLPQITLLDWTSSQVVGFSLPPLCCWKHIWEMIPLLQSSPPVSPTTQVWSHCVSTTWLGRLTLPLALQD